VRREDLDGELGLLRQDLALVAVVVGAGVRVVGLVLRLVGVLARADDQEDRDDAGGEDQDEQ
ncbi:MAG: hypothetical protein ACJ76Q_19205, partial [Solirubrobacteraceae bacterium]